jgi:cytochrome c
MKKLSRVATALTALLIFTASVQAEDLLKNADVAYGEYLAGECVTCHSTDGADKGIPNIIGLEAEGFAYIMHSYRNKELENKVMQLVAGRLDDEQIASLAVYFASLGK